MKQFTITIQDKEGLHARPAGLLSKAAKGFQCAVTLTKGEKTADLKKIFAVMGLAVKGGDSITVACNGADEEAAAAALEKMFAEIKLEPGCSLGTHTHTGEYEVFFFHEGEVTLNDNGTERKMHPGDFAICYDGESHGIANRTDKPASLFAAIIKTK